MAYYALVTYGTPGPDTAFQHRRSHVYRSATVAVKDAKQALGTGNCSEAHVYECDTLELAKTAQYGCLRVGERVFFAA